NPRAEPMTWLLQDQSLRPIADEIERQSDRGVGVIGSSFVEMALGKAVQSRLRGETERQHKAIADLFGRSRPLSSFSAKIDAGLLLGIYRDEIHLDLHRIRQIRNEFSHEPFPRDFTNQMVADHCRALWLPDNLFFLGPGSECPIDARGRFVHAIKLMISFL